MDNLLKKYILLRLNQEEIENMYRPTENRYSTEIKPVSKVSQKTKVQGYMASWEKAMAPHSSTLAWKIPWMEEPARLQSMGSLRVGHD